MTYRPGQPPTPGEPANCGEPAERTAEDVRWNRVRRRRERIRSQLRRDREGGHRVPTWVLAALLGLLLLGWLYLIVAG